MNNNNKKRIFIAIIFIILLFLLLTFAGGRSEVAIVEFIDGFDNSLIDSQEVEIGDDAVVPEDPKHKNYVFAGWFLFEDHDIKVTDFTNIEEDLKVIALYAGDANNNGIADDQDDRFSVTFIDGLTNDVIKTESVVVGMNATAPKAPTHRGYTFIGWDKGYTNIVESTTVTAQYVRNEVPVTMYTVTFVDGDTREVIATQKVQEGKAATLPEAPLHENRVFIEWVGEYSNVKENTTVTAIYADDMNNDGIEDATQPHYDITYKDFDGEVLEVIEDVLVDMPTPTISNPEREYYTFAGWNPDVAETVTDNAEYTATYTANNDENGNGTADEEEAHYTITYVDYNNEVIDTFEDVLVGLDTPTVANPTREFYTFAGWNPEVAETVTGNATYKATYTINNDENGDNIPDETQDKFDVVYVDYDGSVIKEFANVLVDMETPTVANPTREFYTFTGWNPAVAETVTEDATYTATYRANNDENGNGTADEEETKLVVNFVDGITEETIKSEEVLPGLAATAPEAPKHTNYVFVGWDKEFNNVTTNLTVTALYEDDKNNNGEVDENEDHFDITYVDHEDNVIEMFEDVLVGLDTPTIDEPTREFYTFTGWNPSVAAKVSKDATYKATYEPINDKNNDDIADEEQDLVIVKFYGMDNETVINQQWIVRGEDAVAPTPQSVSGFTFVKWLQNYTDVQTDELNVYSEYRDSEAPVVSAEVELYNEKNGHYQNANITATVSDNVGVVEVRYLAGEYDKSNYNSANVMTKEVDGTYQINGLSENSVYTVFAKDAAGNISVTYVEVEGISILEGEFEDLYATGSFGKLSGFPFLTKYKRELNIVTKENVVISDARVYVGNSFKTIQDFENDSNFGDKIEVSDPTNLEYDVIGDTWQYATVYIQYTETYQVSPTQTATRTTSKVYRTFLSYIFG